MAKRMRGQHDAIHIHFQFVQDFNSLPLFLIKQIKLGTQTYEYIHFLVILTSSLLSVPAK